VPAARKTQETKSAHHASAFPSVKSSTPGPRLEPGGFSAIPAAASCDAIATTDLPSIKRRLLDANIGGCGAIECMEPAEAIASSDAASYAMGASAPRMPVAIPAAKTPEITNTAIHSTVACACR